MTWKDNHCLQIQYSSQRCILKMFLVSEMMEKGTELKVLVMYPDGGKAVLKPMR